MSKIKSFLLLATFAFNIHSFAILNPNFNFINLGGTYCLSLSGGTINIQFTNSTTVPLGDTIKKYRWYFNDGSTDTVANPLHQFTLAGSYQVKLKVYDTSGIPDSITKTINIGANRINRIGVADTNVHCYPYTFVLHNLSDTSTGCSSSFLWKIDSSGNGTGSYAVINTSTVSESVSITLTHAGYYPVYLSNTDGCGCNNIPSTKTIRIDSTPLANFYPLDTTGCGSPFNFKPTNSSSNATSYLWKFGDGTTDTAAAPIHTYINATSGPITFYDTLIVSNGVCSSLIKTGQVTINFFDANLSISQNNIITNTVCIGTPVNFNDSTTGVGVNYWHWKFGDGDTAFGRILSHIYTIPGVDTVVETVSNLAGCTVTLSKVLYVDTLPAISISSSPIYWSGITADTVSFIANVIDTASISQYLWTFGDASNDTAYTSTVSHTYPSYGYYSPFLKVTDIHGCFSTFTDYGLVAIYLPADTTILSDSVNGSIKDSGCVYSFFHYDAHHYNNPLISFLAITDSFSFGDGTPDDVSGLDTGTHQYNDTGYFKLKHYYHLDAMYGGGTYIDSITIPVGAHPIINIITKSSVPTTDSICAIDTVHLHSNCTNCLSQYWLISNSRNFTVLDSLPAADTFWVLHHPNSSLVDSEKIKYIYYQGNIHGCLTDSTDTAGGIIDSYSVRHQVIDSIYIWRPNVSFLDSIPQDKCNLPYSLDSTAFLYHKFTNKSADSTDSLYNKIKYIWKYGDGTLDSNFKYTDSGIVYSNSVIHKFPFAGTYTVTLTIIDSVHNATSLIHACSDTISKVVYVYPVKRDSTSLTANKTMTCLGTSITFTGDLTGYGAHYTNYTWSFGNGAGNTLNSGTSNTVVSIPYNKVGIYDVVLYIKNSYGCVDSIMKHNFDTVTAPGYTYLSHDTGFIADNPTGCNPLTVHFHDEDTTQYGFKIISRRFMWSNSHATYYQSLDTNMRNDTITFYNNAANINDIGGLNYNIIRIDSDNLGCVDRDTIYITAQKPYISIAEIDTQYCTSITAGLADTGTNGVNYTWYINNFSTVKNTALNTESNNYNNRGLFYDSVLLIVQSQSGAPFYAGVGCYDTLSFRTNTLINGNSAISDSFSLDHYSEACPDSEAFFNTIHTNNGYTSIWNIGKDSTTFLTGQNLINKISYTYPGIYTVTLIDSTLLGCRDTIRRTISVGGPTGTLTFFPDTVCQGTPVTLIFSDTSHSLIKKQFVWTSGLPLFTSFDSTTSVSVLTPGFVHPVVQIADSNYVCPVNIYASHPFYISPRPHIIFPGDSIICIYTTGTLIAKDTFSSNGSTFIWTPNFKLSCSTCDTTFDSITADTTYKVISTSSFGCIDSNTLHVHVDTFKTLNFSNITNDSVCFSFQHIVYITPTPSSILWTSTTDSNTNGTIYPMVINPASNNSVSSYTVYTRDINNCRDTGNFSVGVHGPSGTLNFYSNIIDLSLSHDTVCQGNPIYLQFTRSLGSPIYDTFVWYAGVPPFTTNDTSASVTDLIAGSVLPYVKISDYSGCTQKIYANRHFYISPKPQLNVNGKSIICPNTTDTLTVYDNIVTNLSTYIWSNTYLLGCNTCSTLLASPASDTTYQVYATSYFGCIDSTTKHVHIDSPKAIYFNNTDSVCFSLKDTILVTTTGLHSITWTSPTDSLLNGTAIGNKLIINPKYNDSISNYFVFAKDIYNCNESDSFSVNVHGPTGALTFYSDIFHSQDTVCQGKPMYLSFSKTPGEPLFDTFVWYAGVPHFTTTDTSSSVIVDTAGSVLPYVKISDYSGCTQNIYANKRFYISSKPQLMVSGKSIICPYTTDTLIVHDSITTNMTTYSWSPNYFLSCNTCNITNVSPLADTAYTVIGTSFFGCINNKTFHIHINPHPNISFNDTNNLCFGRKDTIYVDTVGTGLNSFVWTSTNDSFINSDTAIYSISIHPKYINDTAKYIVYAKYGNNCNDTGTLTKWVYGPTGTLTYLLGDTVCQGNAIHINFSQTGGRTVIDSFEWFAGIPNFNSMSADTSVLVDTFGSVLPYVYISDSTRCIQKIVASKHFYISPTPQLIAIGSAIICPFTIDTLIVRDTIITNMTTFVWTPNSRVICGTCDTALASPLADVTYTVVGTNYFGCKDSSNIHVHIDSPKTIHFNNTDSLCLGLSKTVYIVDTTLPVLSSIKWSSVSDSFRFGGTHDTIIIVPQNINSMANYMVTATYDNNCSDTAHYSVRVHGPTGTVSFLQDKACLNFPVNLQFHNTSNYTLDTTYTWTIFNNSLTDTLIKHDTFLTYHYTDTGNFNINLQISQAGCNETIHIKDTIKKFANPVDSIIKHTTAHICIGQSDTIMAKVITDTTATYKWYTLNNVLIDTMATFIATPLVTDTYKVVATNINNCTDTSYITIFKDKPDTVRFNKIYPYYDSICKYTFDTLRVTNGITGNYSWSSSGTDIICSTCYPAIVSPLITTTYKVIGTDSAGCIDSNHNTITIVVDTVPIIHFINSENNKDIICQGVFDTLIVINNGIDNTKPYIWSGGIGLSCTTCMTDTVIAHPDTTQTYMLVVTDLSHCSDTTHFTVQVTPLAKMTSNLTPNAICDSTLFFYTPQADSAGTTFNWVRRSITDITPTSNFGIDSISEILFNASVLPITVDYLFYMTYKGCRDSQDVKVAVNAMPTKPYIHTKSDSMACSNTMYQNFGALNAPASNINYTWIGENAGIWKVAADEQYCLVNFPDSGLAKVKLLANYKGYECFTGDSFYVHVSNNRSEDISVIYNNGNLICLLNLVDSYQWGYDDKTTLDSGILFNENNQNYYIPKLDPTKYYWVMTTKGGCLQKSYYQTPTSVINTTDENNIEMKVYPNPANNLINVELNGYQYGAFTLTVIDISGKILINQQIETEKTTLNLDKLTDGFYFIECIRNSNRIAVEKFIKLSK